MIRFMSEAIGLLPAIALSFNLRSFPMPRGISQVLDIECCASGFPLFSKGYVLWLCFLSSRLLASALL